jgi:hypothetical protein
MLSDNWSYGEKLAKRVGSKNLIYKPYNSVTISGFTSSIIAFISFLWTDL